MHHFHHAKSLISEIELQIQGNSTHHKLVDDHQLQLLSEAPASDNVVGVVDPVTEQAWPTALSIPIMTKK